MTTATERKLMTAEELLLMRKGDGRHFKTIQGMLTGRLAE